MLLPVGKYSKCDRRTLSLLDRSHLSPRGLHQILARILVSGSVSDPYAAGKVVAAFCVAGAGDGGLAHASLLFRHLPNRSTFLWNAMIRAHVERDRHAEALSFYAQMLASGYLPNNYTFSFLLRASLGLSSLSDGVQLHAQIVKLGWESYDFVQNGLIHMYCSCDGIDSARRLFEASPNRDVISWTAMVNGFVKSGQIGSAQELFDIMPERNAVSWSAMITAYAHSGRFSEALDAFTQMQLTGVSPNHSAIVGALSACGFLGALDQGRWIHAFAERNGMELDRVLGTALIDMYAKCGCVDTARQVFDAMPERDVFAYTSMISGLSNHGESERSVNLFLRMQKEGVRPNDVTFICVLSSCGRMGLVDRGREFFKSMDGVYGIKPGVEHYGCLVDLLSRAGLLKEAKRVLSEMPMEPDSYVLGAFLNACRVHGEVELGKETMESLVELGLDHSGVHVLLSNMYAAAYRWEDVMKVRKGMEMKKVRKVPGCSMIEVDGVSSEFVAGDRSHLHRKDIVLTVKGMDKQLKSFGDDANVLEPEDSLDWTFGY